jgi:diaminohydroxyphosphoribosylaminopyrimidine deaminase/5-amino-6-(5-phosphoribosylamino)uracil reductase
VIAKWAMTLDGAIATGTGDSKWITGERARQYAHELRSRVDAIVVGSETVLRDDPLLTARLPPSFEVPRVAARVVLDRRMRIPLNSQLVRTANVIPTFLVTSQKAIEAESQRALELRRTGVELLPVFADDKTGGLGAVLELLSEHGATNVLVEGGGKLLGAFFDGGWVDQVDCFIAPRILGSENATRPIAGKLRTWMSQSQQLDRVTLESFGMDFHVRGYMSEAGSLKSSLSADGREVPP